jgi:DNA polymerase-4
VVTSASYQARRFGLRSAMRMAEALPAARGRSSSAGRTERYAAIARELRAIFRRYAPHAWK